MVKTKLLHTQLKSYVIGKYALSVAKLIYLLRRKITSQLKLYLKSKIVWMSSWKLR